MRTALLIFIGILAYGASDAQIPESPLIKSWDQYIKKKSETSFHFQWIQTGPVMNSARAEAVQGDPDRPGTYYVAFGSGNLWKTENHGLSWCPIFEDQAALGIGDIALAPSDGNIIYVGTGESLKKPRNFTMPGVGVFRSDDAGNSWTHLGLSDSWHISEIAVHPQNPDIVFVAVLGHFWTPNPNRGLYRSVNGGKTWEHVIYIDENTGANDVVISAANPDMIYASMWNNYPDVAGETSSIFVSSDGGSSWNKCVNGLPSGPSIGRIGLGVSYQDENRVYAFIDNRDKENAGECYTSTDGGVNWERTHTEDLKILAKLGWYFADCYVNPQDDQELFLLGVRMAHSKDGGRSFDLVGGEVYHNNPSTAHPLHLDHCEMWINPKNPQNLMSGNDGGLYISYDRGKTWMHYNNIPVGEFYDISVDQQQPYLIYGGTQDDSSVYGPSSEWNYRFPDQWKYIWLDAWSGGDGCVTYPDPLDPNIIYTSSQTGGIFRKDMAADQSKNIRPRLPRLSKEKLNYNFIAPYIISTHDPATLYHAGNIVFKSTNRGDDWTRISPDLSLSEDPAKLSVAAGAIAESPIKPGLLFVGTDKGAFWVSEDDGNSWTERSKGLPAAYIRSIQASDYDLNRIYLTLSGINYDDLSCHVYVSNDLGINWIDLGSDLPNEIMNCIIEDPVYEDLLYLGGYRGVYFSDNRGKTWSLLGDNMAAAAIADLVIQPNSSDLIAGTHGRGIRKLNLNPIHEFYQNNANKVPFLFTVEDGQAPYYNDTHRDVELSSLKKTNIDFWLPEALPVELIIRSKNREFFRTMVEGKAGFNQYRWDLIINSTDSPNPYFIQFNQYLNAGEYTVEIKGRDFDLTRPWLVLKGTY